MESDFIKFSHCVTKTRYVVKIEFTRTRTILNKNTIILEIYYYYYYYFEAKFSSTYKKDVKLHTKFPVNVVCIINVLRP